MSSTDKLCKYVTSQLTYISRHSLRTRSEEHAQGAEILAYWQSVARKHALYHQFRFQTRVHDAY